MAMTRWDPSSDMVSLRDAMNDLVEQSLVRPTGTFGRAVSTPVDICMEGDNYVVQMALPGADPDSIDVSVQDNTVTVSGEFGSPDERQRDGQTRGQPPQGQQAQGQGGQEPNRRYFHRELMRGRLERTVTLPQDINADAALSVRGASAHRQHAPCNAGRAACRRSKLIRPRALNTASPRGRERAGIARSGYPYALQHHGRRDMAVTKGTTSLASETSALKVGDEAPDFELRSHLGDIVQLGQMRGKNVVIAFYPAAWTSV